MNYINCSTQRTSLVLLVALAPVLAFDDILNHHETVSHRPVGPLPKDKILLAGVERLTFHRHKMTTSRRTHTIHQLSCVGGTAGCKLFKPDTVECQRGALDHVKGRHNWICKADIDDRVEFKHVEVICEGYDYPEDDYILLGSCGLEFTLDYKNPHDYHHTSYFKHMDEHEKELHQDRLRATAGPQIVHRPILGQFLPETIDYPVMFMILLVFLLFFVLTWRFFWRSNKSPGSTKEHYVTKGSSLATAVLAKKAC